MRCSQKCTWAGRVFPHLIGSKLNCRCSSIHTNHLSTCWVYNYFLYFFFLRDCGSLFSYVIVPKSKADWFIEWLKLELNKVDVWDFRRAAALQMLRSCSLVFVWVSGHVSTHSASFSPVLSRFCWAESYVDFLLPATECKLNIRTDRGGFLRSRGERERGSNDRLEDTSVWMYWKTLELRERICTGLVSPRTFFPSAHIYTHLFFREKKKKTCLNDSYHFWTQTNF